MMCEYWDCGWCYAPDDVETSASSQSACFDYEFCPYLKTVMTNCNHSEHTETQRKGFQRQIEELQEKIQKLEQLDKMVEEFKQQTLYDVCLEWKDADINPMVSDLIDRIETWLPKEQSAAGSQNAYVECAVEGFNDCLYKIKSRLR